MVRFGVHHMLVVNADGHPSGVARAIDMASADIRHPLLIRAAIEDASDLDQLCQASALLRPTAVQLHDAGVPAVRTSALIGAMVEAILARCVGFDDALQRRERARSPPGSCWARWRATNLCPAPTWTRALVLTDAASTDRCSRRPSG